MVKRQFGLELESFGLTKNILKNTITGIPTLKWKDNLHTHSGGVFFDRKTWQGMADGSIRALGSRGQRLHYPSRNADPNMEITHEVVSPVLKGGKGMKDAAKVMRGLTRAGAKVNKSTGLHVTFGLDNSRWKRMGKKKRAKSLARIVDTYNWFGPGINTMVAPSRRGTSWGGFNDLQTSLTSKYSAVNLSQFQSGGRVEFRQHQGTLNPKKVREWVNVLDKMLNFSTNEEFAGKDFRDYPRTFEGLAKAIGLNDAQKRYWRGRIGQLGQSSTTGNMTGTRSESQIPVRTDQNLRGLYNFSPDWPAIEAFQRAHGRVD
tara:strand:+ start:6695 stop:7645 length:951 start_codon:yes stop_codon:yes gene_type:complete